MHAHRVSLAASIAAVVVAIAALVVVLTGAGQPAGEMAGQVWDLGDGDYRGHFDDREHQVSVQISIENEEITEVRLRHQQYDGIVYEDDPDVPGDYPIDPVQIEGIAGQYVESLEYLIGAQGVDEIEERLSHMEGTPSGSALDAIEIQEVDAFSAATIRSGKLASAVRDALNRGRYRE